MKKKNNNNKRKFEYLRRNETFLNGIAFKVTTPSPDSHFAINIVGNGKKDRVYYSLTFKPPLEKIYAKSTTIEITHIDSKRTDTRIVVLPESDDKTAISYGDALKYIEFNTHQVRVHEDSVYELFICLLNVQMRRDVDVPIWVPNFNYNLGFFPKMFPNRFEGLPFYPYNIDLGPVDMTKIPCMIPLPNKYVGGEITGSQVGKLLGYYANNTDNDFTGWKGVAARFGTIMEPVIILLYLAAHPNFSYKEPGWWPFRDRVGAGTWTDGVITDEQGNVFGLECKASQNNYNFEGTHIAQCIWAMACGNTPCHDLVKYGEKKVRVDNVWSKIPMCRETRIMRNVEKEEEIIQLCMASKKCKSPGEFLQLISTEPYVNMRNYLDNMANKANTECHTSIDVQNDLIQEMEMYKEKALLVQESSCLGLHPIIDRIEKRQAHMFALFQEEDKEKFRREVCDQMKDYSELIKDSF